MLILTMRFDKYVNFSEPTLTTEQIVLKLCCQFDIVLTGLNSHNYLILCVRMCSVIASMPIIRNYVQNSV